MIKIHIANNISLQNLPERRCKQVKDLLTLPNPAYEKVSRIAGNRFAAQAFFKYYREPKDSPNTLIVPRGLKTRLLRWLQALNEPYTLTEDYTDISIATPEPSHLPLKEHQEKLIAEAMSNPDGIIHAGTGTGKTVTGLELIRQRKVSALILVHNSILLNQFVSEAKEFYNWDIGQIGDGAKHVLPVTVSTWQSLSADENLLSQIKDKFSLILIDEVQGIVSKERAKILSAFKPKHIYGLSATPARSKDDGRTDAITFLAGEIIASHEATLISPTVEIINTRIGIPWQGDYHAMVDFMVKHESRNNLITALAVGEASQGKKVLILVKRREHCSRLLENLKDLNVFYADSDDVKRNEVLLAMRKNNYPFSILIGTLSLLSAGMDIPSLDVLILGSDMKSEILLEQSAGRVLRLFQNKDSAKIYDLYDDLYNQKNPVLSAQFNRRMQVYRQKNWELIVPWEDKKKN